MTALKNDVVNNVTLTNENGVSESIIFTAEESALYGIHAAMLIGMAAVAVEQSFSLSNTFSCKYKADFTDNVNIGMRDSNILIDTIDAEFEITGGQAHAYILEPFGLFLPDLVPSLNDHVFGYEGLTCWLIEDLTGYYTGQDSDYWILTSQGLLIVTEELHSVEGDGSTYLSPIAVFDLSRQWTEKEITDSELLKAIIAASV